jgi:hypothetical protein
MTILEKQDVTANVLEALRRDSERKLALIERSVNRRFFRTFRQFAAIEGSEVFDGFQNGATRYLRYVLRKSTLGRRNDDMTSTSANVEGRSGK